MNVRMEENLTVFDSLTALYPSLDDLTLQELYCNLTQLTQEPSNNSHLYCDITWDGVSCWPSTLIGTTASLPCFSELKGIKYDVSGNASKECFKNATWSKSYYQSCIPVVIPEDEYLQVLWDLRDAVTVYYVGYGISLVALTLALWIFACFKDLRCLRNTIHANLMFTYFLLDITWILTAKLQSSENHIANKIACYLTMVLTYLMGTNFFWMFVEGLYLFILVVKTFSVDNIKIHVYATIGWVIPALIAASWAAIKGYFSNFVEDNLAPEGCPWQKRDFYDYIFIGPVILVLLVNIIFLTKIMWVLITKLRATNTVESEQYRYAYTSFGICMSLLLSHLCSPLPEEEGKLPSKLVAVFFICLWKAAKALLVLIPLLGVTYILVIATPDHRTGEVVFTFIQATLLSIQGFIVAVLYCFLNGEVQNSLRHRLERWKIRQAINRGQHQSMSCRSSPHGEKFYRNRGVRDSCISFATSTSFVNFPPTIRSPSVPAVNRLDCNATAEEKMPMKDDTL